MSTFMADAVAQYPEDEGRASAKHWNEVIRFEDRQYRAAWLRQEQARFEKIFSSVEEFDRYCVTFLKYRISE